MDFRRIICKVLQIIYERRIQFISLLQCTSTYVAQWWAAIAEIRVHIPVYSPILYIEYKTQSPRPQSKTCMFLAKKVMFCPKSACFGLRTWTLTYCSMIMLANNENLFIGRDPDCGGSPTRGCHHLQLNYILRAFLLSVNQSCWLTRMLRVRKN